MAPMSCVTSKRASVPAGAVAHGEVAYVNEAATHVDPELRHVLLPDAERLEDAVDGIHALRRVAVLYRAPDRSERAREDAILAF